MDGRMAAALCVRRVRALMDCLITRSCNASLTNQPNDDDDDDDDSIKDASATASPAFMLQALANAYASNFIFNDSNGLPPYFSNAGLHVPP